MSILCQLFVLIPQKMQLKAKSSWGGRMIFFRRWSFFGRMFRGRCGFRVYARYRGVFSDRPARSTSAATSARKEWLFWGAAGPPENQRMIVIANKAFYWKSLDASCLGEVVWILQQKRHIKCLWLWQEHELFLHCPEGATPKDGPSATLAKTKASGVLGFVGSWDEWVWGTSGYILVVCCVHPPPWFTVDKQIIHFYEGANTNLQELYWQTGWGFAQHICIPHI